jgi:hypothetical protein
VITKKDVPVGHHLLYLIQNFGNKHLFTKQYYKTCETRI